MIRRCTAPQGAPAGSAWGRLLLALVASGPLTVGAAPPLDAAAWPRLFFDPAQRAEVAKRRNPVEAPPAAPDPTPPEALPPPLFTLDGIAQGPRGVSASINGQWLRPGDRLFQWTVRIEPGHVLLTAAGAPALKWKPGQTVRSDTGELVDPLPSNAYTVGRKPTPPEPVRQPPSRQPAR